MEIKRVLIIFFVALFFPMAASAATAVDISSFRISQASAQLPMIKVYLDILSTDGNPAQGILAEHLTATVGANQATVNKIKPFEGSGEGVAYILLVDISRSLKEPEFIQIREALNDWIDAMTGKDRASIMTFGTDVNVVQDFTADKETLKAKVALLKPTDNHTQLHLGLAKAIEMGRRTDPDLPTRRVIVTMSDGHDDFAGGMTKQEVLDRIKEDRVPIYAIGFYTQPGTRKKEEKEEKEEYLKVLGEFARTSGGAYYRAGQKPLEEMYSQMRMGIRRVFVAMLSCDTCNADGRVYRLQINLARDAKSMTHGVDLRLLPTPAPPTPPQQPEASPQPPPKPEPRIWEIAPLWSYTAGGIAIIILLAALLLIRRAGRKPREPEEQELPHKEPVQLVKDKKAEGPVGVKMRFAVVGGDIPGKSYEAELVDRAVIGRSKARCRIVIPDDDEISGRHCELIHENKRVYVCDLDSTNGTYVNGVPISGKHRLLNNDMLMLGGTELRVTISEEKP